MKDFILATSSTADLDIAFLKQHNIPFISYTFTIDQNEYIDDATAQMKDFLYSQMRSGKIAKTSQITMYQYSVFFRELLKEGKDILYLDMSAAFSASIANALAAIEEINAESSGAQIYFVDSFCASVNLGMLIKKLVVMKESGATIKELIDWANLHKSEYIARLMVEDLKWLRLGGRLSNAQAFAATLFSIKPLIYLSRDGRLLAYSKARGRKRCLHELLVSMEEDLLKENPEGIYIIHGDCLLDAQNLAEDLCSLYPFIKKEQIFFAELGPVIASHVGPDLLGVVYRGKTRVR